jgi:hypothetical protein
MNLDVTVKDLLAGIGGDATMRDLFSMTDDRLKAIKAQRDMEAAKRLPVAAAIARVLATDDGKVLFQAMLDMTFRGHVDVVGLGLPSDVALQQLVAENARKEFVVQLVKLAREAVPAE